MIDSPVEAGPVPMPTKLVVYISRSAAGLTLDAVRALMFEARGFNLMNGVMGLLTYDPRGFLQAIEGPAEAIDDVIARIVRDSRHRDMQILSEGPVATPMFGTFHDAIRTTDTPASLDVLSRAARARLAPAVISIVQQGYAMLDMREPGPVSFLPRHG